MHLVDGFRVAARGLKDTITVLACKFAEFSTATKVEVRFEDLDPATAFGDPEEFEDGTLPFCGKEDDALTSLVHEIEMFVLEGEHVEGNF